MIINIIFILIVPLLFLGIIIRVKAIWAGRKGASILQPTYDVIKLLRKSEIISSSTGFIFEIASVVSLALLLGASLLVPFGNYHAIISFKGDFILFTYLLAFSKFISTLSSLDTGSSFEGMGASRELSYTAFLEPAFLMIMASLVYATGLGSMSELVASHTVNMSNTWSVIISVLTILGLFIMMLIEGSRVPFDDPTTHLELTMVHEVMVLDNSGPNLAGMTYAGALKMTMYASLISYFVIPWERGLWFVTGFYFLMMFLQAVAVGLIESIMPRFRMSRNLELAIIPLTLVLLVMFALVVYRFGGV
ncbi:MAG: NADH-quinone oxidoreductase subunit H [Candidatus Cloacimonetes bacterium]|nr:NADH-quinone oxidoreductase subunit H [Candidatus Cloacimonadota bacterium]